MAIGPSRIMCTITITTIIIDRHRPAFAADRKSSLF